MNVEIVISQYLKEQGISPKTQGYSILEDAIYRSFQYPNETAKEIFEYLAIKNNKKSWRSVYRLASYSLNKAYSASLLEGGTTLHTFIKMAVVSVKLRMNGIDSSETV